MYETLAGQPPIVGASPLNTMQMHMTVCAAEFVLPDSTDFLKRNLQKIIFKCLEKSPDERYQTADDLLQDLLDCSQADFAKRTQTGKAQIDLTRLKMPLIVALCALAVALGSWAGYVRCATTIEAPSYYANQPIWNRPIWPLPDPTPFDEQQEHEKLVGQRREDSFHNRGEKKSLAVLGGLLNTADWYREHGGYAEAEKYYLLYRDGQEGKERKAIAEMGIGFSKFKEGDLAEALKCLTKAVDELIAGANPNALPRDLRVDEADTDSDGFILYLTPNAKLAVDHVGFLNELPDVTGADLNKALKYYGTLGEMVTFKVKDEFRRTSKDDKQREIEDDKQKVISSQSAPILCRLGDIDRRLGHANNQSLINFFSAAQGFGKAPDHILDQMKIALGKALVLQPLGRLREAEMALTDALAMKPVDPVLTEQLKPDEDEPRIRGELKHVRAQVRWHQGRYGDALWDQFGPAS
jgi:tetratricopeptide (TPR) repeat protein